MFDWSLWFSLLLCVFLYTPIALVTWVILEYDGVPLAKYCKTDTQLRCWLSLWALLWPISLVIGMLWVMYAAGCEVLSKWKTIELLRR